MKAGKLVSVCEMKISSGEVIPEQNRQNIRISDKGYKYLGILEANNIIHTELKDKMQKEYYRRVRQVASSKLNGENTIREINSRAVSLVRYSARMLKWIKDEPKVMNRKTPKIMAMNRM